MRLAIVTGPDLLNPDLHARARDAIHREVCSRAWSLVETISEERAFSRFAPGIYATDLALDRGLSVREWFVWGHALVQRRGTRVQRETWGAPLAAAPDDWRPYIEAVSLALRSACRTEATRFVILRDGRLHDPWLDDYTQGLRADGHEVLVISLDEA